MKKKLLIVTLISAVGLSAWAAVLYNQTITAIYGSGNPNTGWTADTSNGIQLALRAKNRDTGSTSNVAGVYSFPVGPAPRGAWNYEFSINSDVTNGTNPLSTYDYYLSADDDPSQCIRYTTVDALNYWMDNSYGNNGTANGQGVEGTAVPLAATNNIAQNSENITFGDYPGGPQTLGNATYNYELYAVEKGAGPNGPRLASVGITVVVGNGGAACNTPATAGQCKNDGWQTRTRGDGSTFKNQGDCIQYANTGK
ncbi:MAG: hypothetical protein ACJ8NS_05355 [Chthoniobacterales bacterium]